MACSLRSRAGRESMAVVAVPLRAFRFFLWREGFLGSRLELAAAWGCSSAVSIGAVAVPCCGFDR